MSLNEAQRRQFLASLTDEQKAAKFYDWLFWARPAQLPPEGDWDVWVIIAGRGFGKTRPGAEWIIQQARQGNGERFALVGKNPDDYNATMIKGDSGILTKSAPWFTPRYIPTQRLLLWPVPDPPFNGQTKGCQAKCFSGEAPDDLRGPQHHKAWVDELAKFKYPQETWDNLELGMRLGEHPRTVVTTTPRPIKTLKEILKDPKTVKTGGSTYDNADFLPPAFLAKLLRKYEGTRLGRQELHAEMLSDVPGALFTLARFDVNRVKVAPTLSRIIIPIDPAGSSDEEASETGIVPCGLGADDKHGYLLADVSGHYTPGEWARKAIEQYLFFRADAIVGEKNHGGEMVGHTIRQTAKDMGVEVKYYDVTASKGKYTRAEPIGALDEQGRIHVVGNLADLEDQMSSWVPGMDSPDRLDSAVWGLSALMLRESIGLELLGSHDDPSELSEEDKELVGRARLEAGAEDMKRIIKEQGAYFP